MPAKCIKFIQFGVWINRYSFFLHFGSEVQLSAASELGLWNAFLVYFLYTIIQKHLLNEACVSKDSPPPLPPTLLWMYMSVIIVWLAVLVQA